MEKFTKVTKRFGPFPHRYITTKDMELDIIVKEKSTYEILKRYPGCYYLENDIFLATLSINILDSHRVRVQLKIIKGFEFDGATCWPDWGILEAALFHDAMGRFLGKKWRILNDKVFKELVIESTGKPWYGTLVHLGVRFYSKFITGSK